MKHKGRLLAQTTEIIPPGFARLFQAGQGTVVSAHNHSQYDLEIIIKVRKPLTPDTGKDAAP